MRVRQALACAAALAALSACETGVGTSITVTGSKTATIEVSATFRGEAAEVLSEDAKVRQGLIDVFENRTGRTPDLKLSKSKVTAATSIDYDQVDDLAPITGVGAITVTDDGHTVAVDLVDVVELRKAIKDQVATAEDAVALEQTLLDITTVSVAVTYPGGVKRASTTAQGTKVTTSNNTATLTRSAGHATTGTLTVTGDPDGPNWVLFGVVGAVVVLGAGVVARRWW